MRKNRGKPITPALPWVLLAGLFISILIVLLSIWVQPNSFRDMLTRLISQPLLFIMNLLPVVLVLTGITFLLRNVCWSGALTSLLFCLTSLASRIKIETRYEAVLPRDFLLLREVGSALESYDISFPWPQFAVILVFSIVLLLAGFLLQHKRKYRPFLPRLAGCFASIALLTALTLTLYANDTLYFGFETSNYYNHITTYNEFGFPYSFFHHFTSYTVDKPDSYNKTEAEGWNSQTASAEDAKDVHIIMVMNEAFSDLTDHEAFSYTEENDPLKNFHAACQGTNAISGHLVVTNIGGGTSNTEFDVLTGIQSGALSAATTVALGAITQNTDSLFRCLNQDYATSFIHPSVGWFYNRENSYNRLGVETQIYDDDLTDPEKKGSWITDDYMAGYIESLFEKTVGAGELMCSYLTTFQNHMSYTADKYGEGYEFPPVETTLDLSPEAETALEVYIEGIRDADAMLGRLMDYFSAREEPVILVFFGDHLPSLGSGNSVYDELGIAIDASASSAVEYYYAYSTAYLIWANDAAASLLDWENAAAELELPENGLISACYLGGMLLELTDREADNPWFTYLNDLRHTLPVARSGSYMTSDGTLTFTLTPEQEALVETWRNWSYYKLRDEEIG